MHAVCMATPGEVSLQEEAAVQVVDMLKETAAQEGAHTIPVEGELSVRVQACITTPGEVSACNGTHAIALAAQRVGMTSLAQAPLDSNPLVPPGIVMAWGGEGEQDSESCVSPSSKNFFELLPIDQLAAQEGANAVAPKREMFA
jgi:hypothetical protein